MKKYTSSKGFAILFTILISSVILSIALGISSIAYNESILSASAREAHYSFFAADSGVECALAYESVIANGITPIDCGGAPVDVISLQQDSYFFYEKLVSDTHCAYVTIDKNVPVSTTQNMQSSGMNSNVFSQTQSSTLVTKIVSHGYNIPCSHVQSLNMNPSYTDPILKKMVERVIEITY